MDWTFGKGLIERIGKRFSESAARVPMPASETAFTHVHITDLKMMVSSVLLMKGLRYEEQSVLRNSRFRQASQEFPTHRELCARGWHALGGLINHAMKESALETETIRLTSLREASFAIANALQTAGCEGPFIMIPKDAMSALAENYALFQKAAETLEKKPVSDMDDRRAATALHGAMHGTGKYHDQQKQRQALLYDAPSFAQANIF